MKRNTLLLAVATAGMFSTAASATSLDFRHEYKSDTKQHASRVKMGHTFENNLSVDLEVKFKGEEGKFMEDLKSNGTEIGINYKYQINDEWALIPGMPIEFSNSGDTYKPQLRLTYTPKAWEGFSISGRYRLDVKPGESNTDNGDRRLRHRYTANLGYKYQQWTFGAELNYYYSDSSDYILYDNKRTNYENNLTVHYKMGDWTPWVEFGDVSVDKNSSDRELRSRVGIRYSF